MWFGFFFFWEGGSQSQKGEELTVPPNQLNCQICRSHIPCIYLKEAEAKGAEPRCSDIRSDGFRRLQATSSLQGSILLLECPSDSSELGLNLSTSQGKRPSTFVLPVFFAFLRHGSVRWRPLSCGTITTAERS